MMEEMVIDVQIVEARDLLASDKNGLSDPYVVVEDSHGIIDSVKTPVIKKTLSPMWDFRGTVHFDPSFSKIKFKVYDWDRFSNDDLLGSCSIDASMLPESTPIDVWQPLKQKGKKGATKGQLHLRLMARGWCPFCFVGYWYALQAPATAGALPYCAQSSMDNALTFSPWVANVCLGLGWEFKKGKKIDLDASVLAFAKDGRLIDTVYFNNRTGCNGAIVHNGDSRSGAGTDDDEVISLNLDIMPESVTRIVCIVNSYSEQPLSSAKSAYVRLFMGLHTLGAQKLTKVCNGVGLLFCFLQRSSKGTWFFQTVLEPIRGFTAKQSLPDICEFLTKVPYF